MWRQGQGAVAAELTADDLEFHTDLYVFSNDVTRSTPRRPDLASKTWNAIRERADVSADVELRSLRNWHITVLREAGFPLEFIGRRVGHEGRKVSPLA
jgi:intergrase/recombinase